MRDGRAPLMPEPPRRAADRGARDILDGRLWILRTGAPWRNLPARYPPYQTYHRRFQQWARAGAMRCWRRSPVTLPNAAISILVNASLMAPLQVPKKGSGVGKTKRGHGPNIMARTDAHGGPIAIHVASASPHAITLGESTLAARFTEYGPERRIGDPADDSDPHDAALAAQGSVLLAPHRANRKKPKAGTLWVLRRYKRR